MLKWHCQRHLWAHSDVKYQLPWSCMDKCQPRLVFFFFRNSDEMSVNRLDIFGMQWENERKNLFLRNRGNKSHSSVQNKFTNKTICRLFQEVCMVQINSQAVGLKWKLDLRLVFALEWLAVLSLAVSVHWGLSIGFFRPSLYYLLIIWNCCTFRYGLRGRELINNVGKVMIQGGGTFGTFMAIGTGIRC